MAIPKAIRKHLQCKVHGPIAPSEEVVSNNFARPSHCLRPCQLLLLYRAAASSIGTIGRLYATLGLYCHILLLWSAYWIVIVFYLIWNMDLMPIAYIPTESMKTCFLGKDITWDNRPTTSYRTFLRPCLTSAIHSGILPADNYGTISWARKKLRFQRLLHIRMWNSLLRDVLNWHNLLSDGISRWISLPVALYAYRNTCCTLLRHSSGLGPDPKLLVTLTVLNTNPNVLT